MIEPEYVVVQLKIDHRNLEHLLREPTLALRVWMSKNEDGTYKLSAETPVGEQAYHGHGVNHEPDAVIHQLDAEDVELLAEMWKPKRDKWYAACRQALKDINREMGEEGDE